MGKKFGERSFYLWCSVDSFLLLFFLRGCLKSFQYLQHINNSHVQKQDYKMALKKYRKALRYLDVCWEKEGIDEGEL